MSMRRIKMLTCEDKRSFEPAGANETHEGMDRSGMTRSNIAVTTLGADR